VDKKPIQQPGPAQQPPTVEQIVADANIALMGAGQAIQRAQQTIMALAREVIALNQKITELTAPKK